MLVLAASDGAWALVSILCGTIVFSLAVVAYGFSLRRIAKLGTRSFYRDPDQVGGGLIALGSIMALACLLGLVFSFVWLTHPS